MTILSSFWVITSREIGGERFWWCNAIMDINMLNAGERFGGPRPGWRRFVQTTPQEWCFEFTDHNKDEVSVSILLQDEQPPLVNEKKTAIYDHRVKDLRFAAQKSQGQQSEPVKIGFKQMPLIIKL